MLVTSLRRFGCTLVAFASAAMPLLAQRSSYTVGGVSPDFVSLPTAVATVPAGSVLVVRPGTHYGFTTNKPLRVLLDFDSATGVLVAAAGAPYAITIANLPPGDEFVLIGRDAPIAAGTVGAIRLANTAAPVVLERVYLASVGGSTGLDVVNCTAVHVRRSILGGYVGLQAQDANVVLGESVMLGAGAAAAVVYRTRLEGTRCYFTGWQQPGLRAIDSVVRLSSNGTTAISVVGGPTIPVAAIEAIGSDLQLDETTLGLLPANGAPGVDRLGGTLLVDDVPMLTALGAPLGMTATATMTSNTPRPGALLIGFLAPTPAPFQLANVFVDLAMTPAVVGIGTCDANGFNVAINLPPAAGLLGQIWSLQGVVWRSDGTPVPSAASLWVAL